MDEKIRNKSTEIKYSVFLWACYIYNKLSVVQSFRNK